MSSFTQAIFEKTDRRTKNVFLRWGSRPYYRLAGEGFKYDLIFLGSPLSIKVEAGFITDLASIPWFARWLFDVKRLAKAAAVHDKMREDPTYSRLECDLVFHLAMETAGVIPWQREICAFAVRLNKSRKSHQL